jgi:hypothetical protein
MIDRFIWHKIEGSGNISKRNQKVWKNSRIFFDKFRHWRNYFLERQQSSSPYQVNYGK